jgi:3-methyladenine DNA glycosylase AlkD
MGYKLKRELKRLDKKQFIEDIQSYIKSPYDFYNLRVPELKIMAKTLKERHPISEFYKIFDKLWNSGYNQEISLAIYTLELYEDEFTLKTFKFLVPKLKDIKNCHHLDAISLNILGKIILKFPEIEKDIIQFTNSDNYWLNRCAIISTMACIENEKVQLTLKIAQKYISNKNSNLQRITGIMLKKASEKKPGLVKSFILKNMDKMSINCFMHATENLIELRQRKR